MSIDPPWRLDPLQTITDVHWQEDDRYIVIALDIEPSPTIDFQRTHFTRYKTNIDTTPGPNPGDTTGVEWIWFVTEFRWVWASQAIIAENFSGGVWTSIEYGTGPPVSGLSNVETIAADGVSSGRGRSVTLSGLPSLPVDQSVGNAEQCAAVGPGNNAYWPNARWAPVTGGPVLTDAGDPINVPGFSNTPFKTGTSVSIRMRGVPMIGPHGQAPLSLPWHVGLNFQYATPWFVGFQPEGGPYIASSGVHEDDLSTFGEFEIDTSSIVATAVNIPKTWRAVGCALAQGDPWESGGAAASGRPGIMYVLLDSEITST